MILCLAVFRISSEPQIWRSVDTQLRLFHASNEMIMQAVTISMDLRLGSICMAI